MAQSFSRSFVLADYLVNVETYKKACINKAKPMLHCNGKCQMLKKIKKQEGESQANAPVANFNQNELVLSSKSFFPSIRFIIKQNGTKYYSYNTGFTFNYVGAIFHPPCNSIC